MYHNSLAGPLLSRTRSAMRRSLRTTRIAPIFTALVLLLSLFPPGAPRQAALAQGQPQQSALITPRGGNPFFVVGANYEGATDRAWMMWENDKFDRDLIGSDFAKASDLGVNTMRIFVQTALREDINAGNFSKLDAVTAIARQAGMKLILTFTDWPEPDLAKAADLNGRIAQHLANEPSILAYDIKNEPQFTDIAGAIYPSGTPSVPLQTPDLIAQYGERVPRDQIGDYRKGEGKNIIPARMNDDQAYIMANYYRLFKEFLDAGAAWVNSHPGTTTLDYMDAQDSASWQPYLAALDTTMGAWVDAQANPVRQNDPGRPITVGYSNIVLAKMPSNRKLEFQSVHRFTSHGYAGLNATFLVLNNLQRTFSGEPVMLEEFGYPGQVWSGGSLQGFDPRITSNLEAAIWTYLYSKGFAGGCKWMLNNFPQGANPAENSYGLFDNNGQPKITAYSLRQVAGLFSGSQPGTISAVQPDDNYAVNFAYTSPDGLVAGGRAYTGTNVIFSANAPSQLVVGTSGGSVTLFATDVSTTNLNLPGIFGMPTTDLGRVTLTGTDPQGQPWTPPLPALNGDWLQVNLRPLYHYRLAVVPRALDPAEAQPDPNTVYFPQTQHNLGGEFLKYWQEHGGLPIFGYPLSEAFNERGYTVQYFERNRFELHPENQPPYNVLLGRLGVDIVAERTFPQVAPFASSKDHRYFPETGHGLHFAFLGYWNANGGLAQFGYPISDEIKEVSPTDGKEYTVQYFERARFEYHPEYKGTKAEVLLGLLGANSLKNRGWLP